MNCYITKPIRTNTLQVIISNVFYYNEHATTNGFSPVIKELFETIGREKVLGISWVFHEELEQFFNNCFDGIFDKDNNALAEAAHKMKGSAAVLGHNLLEKPLAQLESDARDGVIIDLTNRIIDIVHIAKQTETKFNNDASNFINQIHQSYATYPFVQ